MRMDSDKRFLQVFSLFFCSLMTLICGAQTATQDQQNPDRTSHSVRGDLRYELVFPDSYDGRIKWKFAEYEQITTSQERAFVADLNRWGALGYKLVASVYGLPTAIVVQDEGRYVYDTFETRSSVPYVKNGLREDLEKVNDSSFRLVDHLLISRQCNVSDLNDPVLIESCQFRDLFIIEKLGLSKKNVKQMVISSSPGWGSRTSVDLTAGVNAKLKEGFYPVKLISKFEVALERGELSEELNQDKLEFEVISSDSTADLEKKVNEIARQGFRLAFAENGIALLYRNETTSGVPASYKWVRADKNGLDKELNKLEQLSARYCTVYPDDNGIKNSLIFEVGPQSSHKPSEFKSLHFSFDFKEKPSQERVYVDLDPPSKEQLRRMNDLAKGGFVVRGLFQSDRIRISDGAQFYVLLERAR